MRIHSSIAVGALLVTLLQPSPASAEGETFTVNTADDLDFGACDSDHCSLREAIKEANAEAGLDTIAFDLQGGNLTIRPGAGFPAVTDPVVIDGTTQPGFTGTPLVELRGGGRPGAVALTITGGGSTVRDLILNGWSGAESAGIQLTGEGGNVIQGNYVGTNAAGTMAVPNSIGIWIAEGADNLVGGSSPSARNVVSGSSSFGRSGTVDGAGILLGGLKGAPARNRIQGNYIGTTADGTTALPNVTGVDIRGGSGNTVGGIAPGTGNVISGNGVGVSVAGTDQRVRGNLIGTGPSGTAPLGNTGAGVFVRIGNASVGGSAPNVIAFNGKGVSTTPVASASIRGNSIFSNGGLGIDLRNDGLTPNDSGLPGTLNFPILTSAVLFGSNVTVKGTYHAAANVTYLLQFFSNFACDASGNGEGRNFLGSTLVTTGSGGNATFTRLLTYPGQKSVPTFTATATSPDDPSAASPPRTSEFSACRLRAPVADLAVSQTDDPDPVTLGNDVTYHITVTNQGPSAASDIVLRDATRGSFTFVSATPSQGTCPAPPEGGSLVCRLGNLPSGEAITVDLILHPTETNDRFSNTATVSSGGSSDTRIDDNSSQEDTAVVE